MSVVEQLRTLILIYGSAAKLSNASSLSPYSISRIRRGITKGSITNQRRIRSLYSRNAKHYAFQPVFKVLGGANPDDHVTGRLTKLEYLRDEISRMTDDMLQLYNTDLQLVRVKRFSLVEKKRKSSWDGRSGRQR
mgnify:CR=1 FL=1